ncbi:FAS1-like dehydratase domain-containing protein [Peribacillus kribbensis]|uniref:FAS1-like dehydratase domain-containing protein n=1 Tax=Peribacillus kribbensis TaxID=356658 RepID=UPI00042792CB|nr:MaoC family dehydratase N-terminal domain-containing protein [Peribacillus kribbensis]
MLKEYIGLKSEKVLNRVEGREVKKFVEAIGDPHPLFHDEKTGEESIYQANIAPPTFPAVFDYGEIDGLRLPDTGLIHGEQSFHYNRPLVVGDEILCYTEVEDYYERKGASGLMGFLILRRFGEDSIGQTVFSSKAIVIITETVREEMIVR